MSDKNLNQIRRVVARRLRVKPMPALHKDQHFMNVFEDFVADMTDFWDYRETEATPEGFDACCNLLADLIDRPVCNDVAKEKSQYDDAGFRCSNCGCYCSTWLLSIPTLSTGDGWNLPPRYCPMCGAEVQE